jgi:hypothetical protein
MSSSGDHLLYVLSAKREIAWSAFKRVFEVLYQAPGLDRTEVEQARPRRTSTIRALQGLGHCDFVFNESGSRVFIAPAVLARLPTGGLPQAVLCGARSPQTLSQLQEECAKHGCSMTVSEQPKTGGLLPRRICVQANSASDLQALAASLGVTVENTPTAWSLASVTRPLSDVLAGLRWDPGGDLTWMRRDFDEQALQFRADAKNISEVRLSRYLNPTKGTHLHWLWRASEHATIDCDWGRYAVLQNSGKNVLYYDERTMDFAAPRGAPLPKLVSRSLCVCSGYAPRSFTAAEVPWHTSTFDGYNIYSQVPLRIAELVAAAVGQSLIPHPI